MKTPIVFASLLVAQIVGCERRPQTVTTPKVMPPYEMECTYLDQRVPTLRDKYLGHISGNEQSREWAVRILTKVPDAYLKWMFDDSSMPLTIGGGGGGVTQLQYSMRPGGGTPISMQVGGDSDAMPENLLHEVGHATDTLLERTHPDFYERLSQTYSEAMANESQGMWDYAMSDRDEYFAQAFSAYYCSPQTYARLKSEFPRTFAFLSEFLQKPLDLSGQNDDAPNPPPPSEGSASRFECKDLGGGLYRPFYLQATLGSDQLKDWSQTSSGLLGQNPMSSLDECSSAVEAANHEYGVICSRTGLDGWKPTLYTGTIPGRADFGYLGGSSIMEFGECLKATKGSSQKGVCYWGGSSWYVSPIDHEGSTMGPYDSVEECVDNTKE